MEEKTLKAKKKGALEALYFPSLTVHCRLTHTHFPSGRVFVVPPSAQTHSVCLLSMDYCTSRRLPWWQTARWLIGLKQERKKQTKHLILQTWKTRRLPVTSETSSHRRWHERCSCTVTVWFGLLARSYVTCLIMLAQWWPLVSQQTREAVSLVNVQLYRVCLSV